MDFKTKTALLVFFLSLFSVNRLHAESFKGELMDVLDGDTIEVLHDGKREPVRLAKIYAPLEGQPFGKAAKNFVFQVAAQKMVSVQFETYDLYGRPVGEVFLPDGTNLNKLILASGYAWHYKGFSDDPEYKNLETRARETRSGLWVAENPVPPWEWRWVQHQVNENKFQCGTKRFCHEMSSCDEAKFYYYACGLNRLDSDGDGVPCNAKCR